MTRRKKFAATLAVVGMLLGPAAQAETMLSCFEGSSISKNFFGGWTFKNKGSSWKGKDQGGSIYFPKMCFGEGKNKKCGMRLSKAYFHYNKDFKLYYYWFYINGKEVDSCGSSYPQLN